MSVNKVINYVHCPICKTEYIESTQLTCKPCERKAELDIYLLQAAKAISFIALYKDLSSYRRNAIVKLRDFLNTLISKD